MEIYSEDTLNQFIAQNPLRFSEKRMKLVKKDFYRKQRKTVSDEFVDFVLWAEEESARHEHFGAYLLPFIRKNQWNSILEVGCGEEPLLAEWLYHQLEGEVSITAMDICEMHCHEPHIPCIQKAFSADENLSGYDAVIAQEPCDAAERIIKACTGQKVPFCVILCGVPHTRLTGELDEDAYAWYAYLIKSYPNCGFQIWKNGRFSSGCIYSESDFYRE